MENKNNSVIIGAGLVGSLLAINLAKRGIKVNVYEYRPDMRSTDIYAGRSINLAMSTRGWTALNKVGMGDKLKEIAIPMFGRQIHNADGTSTYQPYGKENEAIYSVSRGELNKQLIIEADKFENVSFRFNQKLVKNDVKRNHLLLCDMDSNNTYETTADVIFGADGAFSRIRYGMQKMPRFDYSQEHLPHIYKELTIPAGPNGEFLIEKNALHIWPRGNFMMIALPNIDGSFTCTLFVPFDGKDSIAHIQTEAEATEYMQQHFADSVPLMPNLAKEFLKNPSSNLVTVRCFPWVNGRTALIGDSCHAIVPFYGQGMNCGFEDVRVLDELIDENDNNWDRILEAYELSRKPNGDAIADLALQNFIEMRDLVADPKFILRKKIEKYIHEHIGSDFLPLYSMVSFSNIPYAEALAEGKKQDRLMAEILAIPDIESNWQQENIVNYTKEWLLKNKN